MPRRGLSQRGVRRRQRQRHGLRDLPGLHCSCCKEDKCPVLTYSYFDAGSKDKCNEKACASEFYWCPDAGAHNDDTINVALYTGKNAPASAPAAAAPAGLHVTKEKTEMPTYGAALLSIFLIGLFGTCLLYTSPSPRDQRGSRMPSSA